MIPGGSEDVLLDLAVRQYLKTIKKRLGRSNHRDYGEGLSLSIVSVYSCLQ